MGGTGLLIFLLGFVIIFKVNGQNSLKIELVAGPYHLAEGPHWDIQNEVLYFVDIFNQTIHCLNPSTKKITGVFIKNGPVGVAVPVAGKINTFIAGSGTDLVQVEWNPKTDNSSPEVKLLARVDVGIANMRFNDGKVDPMGRFWAGTMNQQGSTILPNMGTLYRFENQRSPAAMIGSTTISNGLVWSHNNRYFYWIDTPTLDIYGFDYDIKSGNITNKRVVFNFERNNVPGKPDGMTIDKAGNLWIACYAGGRVIQINPLSGKLLRHVELPAKQITSVAFGGRNLDILYVTSTRENMNASQISEQPMAGFVFAIYGLGAVGTPMRAYKL